MVDRVRSSINSGNRSVLLQSPTGSGKTVIAGHMASRAAHRGNSTLFLVHRQELVRQSVRTFGEFDAPCGVIAAGQPMDLSAPIQVAMIGTLTRRLESITPPKIIIIDEAHHAVAATYKRVLAAFPESKIIGLTATPERLDGAGLCKLFDALVLGPSVRWLIENRFLADFRAFSPESVDTDSLDIRAGDFVQEQAAALMDKPTITGDVIGHYQRLAPGQRMIVFAAGINHSKNVAAAYQQAGIAAEHVDGETPEKDREAAIARFTAGQTLVLSNVALFGEGFDVPAAGAVQILRPTLSLALHLQMIGRALRYMEGKTAYILDHVGGIKRHGLPDQEREWSLEGRARKPKRKPDDEDPDVFAIKCSECSEWIKPARNCPYCGHTMAVSQRRKFLKVVPGELVEIYRKELMEDANTEEKEEIRMATRTTAEIQTDQMREKMAALAEIPKAKTLAEFQSIAHRAGYKSGWAWRRFHEQHSGRNAREIALTDFREQLLQQRTAHA